MIALYDRARSGHCHRVRLFLSLLKLPHELRNTPRGPSGDKSADYLALNPLGQVPTLVDGETVIADSTAILVYLARRYDPSGTWLPTDPEGAARVQRWLSLASGELYRGPVLARAIRQFGNPADPDLTAAVSRRLLDFMEQHLAHRSWLAADHATLADVALYSYLAVADEGGLSLSEWPSVRAWMGRVEALPGFVSMPRA